MHRIDLNADLGEGGGEDEEFMSLISSVNIACGGHAGNKESIQLTIDLALQAQVAIGAHPGYEDRPHFGRRAMQISSDEIRSLIIRQLERILAIHPQLHHVKPHGALYNQSNQSEPMAEALVLAISEILPNTILYCPPNGALVRAADEINLATCPEGFIDRRYEEDGSLCPRTETRAMIERGEEAVSQALKIATQREVITRVGTTIPLIARSLCVHGDHAGALNVLRLTRSSLELAGIEITAP